MIGHPLSSAFPLAPETLKKGDPRVDFTRKIMNYVTQRKKTPADWGEREKYSSKWRNEQTYRSSQISNKYRCCMNVFFDFGKLCLQQCQRRNAN